MSAFNVTSVSIRTNDVGMKEAIVVATGPTSYDANGSILDLSSADTDMGDAALQVVEGCALVGADSAAAALQTGTYLRAASGAPATGRVVMHAVGAEVAGAANLSGNTYRFRVTGR